MNIHDANKYISALNQIAVGAARLAAAIEESGWEGIEDHAGLPGTRPIAAVRIAEPSFEAEAEECKVPHQEASKAETTHEPESEPEPVTLEQVRAVLATASQAGHTARVRELIQATGAGRLSEVDPGKYAWLLAQAEGLADAAS